MRHPEHEDFLEENWLFEAITEILHSAAANDAATASREAFAFQTHSVGFADVLLDVERSASCAIVISGISTALWMLERECDRNQADKRVFATFGVLSRYFHGNAANLC